MSNTTSTEPNAPPAGAAADPQAAMHARMRELGFERNPVQLASNEPPWVLHCYTFDGCHDVHIAVDAGVSFEVRSFVDEVSRDPPPPPRPPFRRLRTLAEALDVAAELAGHFTAVAVAEAFEAASLQ